MLKSSQNIWILEKQNTAEVAGRRRAWEAISSDSSRDKGRAMAVFVLITVESPPWRRYLHMSLALVVMPHLTAPHSCALRHSQAGYVQGRPQQHLLPSPSCGASLSKVRLANWAVGIPITTASLTIKALFSLLWGLPSSSIKNQTDLTLSVTTSLGLGSPTAGKDGQKNIAKLFHWHCLVGPSVPDSSVGCCKRDKAFLVGSSQGKWFYLHICNSLGRGRRQRVQCHRMRIKLCIILQNVN